MIKITLLTLRNVIIVMTVSNVLHTIYEVTLYIISRKYANNQYTASTRNTRIFKSEATNYGLRAKSMIDFVFDDIMASSQHSEGLTQQEKLSLVNDTVLYIISHDSLNLIKRQDLIKNILKEKKRHFSEIMKLVKERLVQDFGVNLVDVEDNKVFAVVYRVTDKFNVYPAEVEADRILLILVLTLIFMNNGVMAEDDIMKTLKRLKIKSDAQDKKHETFGDVENSIKKKFVRWLFLESNTIAGTDPPQYEFRWGRRAEIQISKKGILDFACEILETTPDSWDMQYEEVEKQKIVT